MAKREAYPGDPDDLRRRADYKLRKKNEGKPENPEAQTGVNRLVHELNVHKIELEMQNEELRKAQLALEETRDKYIDLYDFAPVGYFTFTPEALIQEVNLTGAALLGIERQKLISARFRRFVAPEGLDKWDRYLLNVLAYGEKQSCDLQLIRENGGAFNARIEGIRLSENNGIAAARAAISDVTIQKKAEEELQHYSFELERKNKELQEALDKVKTLSGMLPICSYCKKIRDDKGYWEQVDTYILKHTDTEFSHGICPDCAEKLRKEYEEFKRKGKEI